MSSKRRDKAARSTTHPAAPVAERCHCQPLSSPQAASTSEGEHTSVDIEKTTPASATLKTGLQAQLADFFPRSTSLSLLLIHVSQLEHVSLSRHASINKRQRYHASGGFLTQVLANVRRAIRNCDQILIDEGVGAALIFPEVDPQGISKILERIYRNVSLLQAGTVIPPIKHETDVVMGIGSYQEHGGSLEHLLRQVSMTARRFTLRPSVTSQLWSIEPLRGETKDISNVQQTIQQDHIRTGVPFMQLPSQLPLRLKQLIPYAIALKLCCAPVGRNHHCLTVAMAEPADSASIRYLTEVTGLTIFPVGCDVSILHALLAKKW